jgi:signal transduction histidine kinase
VTYVLVDRATANPLVYRGASGELAVTFSDRGVPGAFAGRIFGEAGDQIPPGPIVTSEGSGPIPPDDLPTPEQIRSLAVQQRAAQMGQLLLWSGVALAIMAVASIGAGWLVAGRALAPLRRMTADVRQISAADLHRRLTRSGPDDELSDLGATFNDLLGRLERSFEGQRQFVANASHELRTPLARQRTLIQVALEDPSVTLASLRATVERVLVAGEQLEKLVEALFTLARGERGLERRERVDLAAVANDVMVPRRIEIERSGLRLDTQLDPAPISGDPRLLERLVANLVDNAVRYNVPSGRLEVTTATGAGSAVLRVTNSGPVVPPAQVDRIFQPFRRLGADRTHSEDSWGLGLSIVRAIASAHDAVVTARADPAGGLDIEVNFPAA